MTDYNYSPENLVEVNLTFDCYCNVPYKNSEGEISWKEAYPFGDKFHVFEGVKVPKEATVSKAAIDDYLLHLMENNMNDLVYLSDGNIFDKNVGGDGAFRFD